MRKKLQSTQQAVLSFGETVPLIRQFIFQRAQIVDLERQELGNRTVVKRAQGREWRHRKINSCYIFSTTENLFNNVISTALLGFEKVQDIYRFCSHFIGWLNYEKALLGPVLRIRIRIVLESRIRFRPRIRIRKKSRNDPHQSQNTGAVESQNVDEYAQNGVAEAQKGAAEGLETMRPVVSDSHHFDEEQEKSVLDPDPH
jgi:hypothetical protein